MAGPYTIATPVTNTPVPSALFGQAVKDAINDLHTRVATLEVGTQSIIKRGRRITSTGSLTGTGVGVLRIDDVPVKAGRLYRITTSNLNFISSVANDIGLAAVRFVYAATTGTVGTTGNTTLLGNMRNVVDVTGSTNSNTVPMNVLYVPTADGYISVLLTATRAAGTGVMTMYGSAGEPIDMTISYEGIDPGDSGVSL
jgi:hypothetical protein